MVYRWLLGSGYAAENIVIGGDSAGGGLAASALLKLRDDGAVLPAGAFLMSPMLDLTFSGPSVQSRAHLDPVVTLSALQTAADYYLWLFPNHYISSDALPFELTQAIAHWDIRLAAAHRLVPHISHAVLVEPDGSPVALQPALAGANTVSPQPDTITPKGPDD